MITGRVITGRVDAARREALIRLIVKGGEGRAAEVEAVIDTGFTRKGVWGERPPHRSENDRNVARY